jgi:hypothetical protein
MLVTLTALSAGILLSVSTFLGAGFGIVSFLFLLPGLALSNFAFKQWYSDRVEEIHGWNALRNSYQDVSDATLAKTAKKYGGVLTKTIIAYALDATLDQAQNALDRYVKHGEARRIQIGEMDVYDIPSARVHLLGTDKAIIEIAIGNKGKVNRTQLLRESGQSIEALDASLKRLESQGMLVRNPDNTYRLAVVS